jgi:F-type H+-transporting ATPase subunit epsilon
MMLRLELITLSGAKLQDEVYEVILPTSEGGIAVYPQHMPLVTTIVPGVVKVRRKKTDSDDNLDIFATNGGVAEISGTTLRLLVDEATHADEIVEQEAAEALAEAKKLKEEAKDEVELERAQAMVDRQAVRLKVAELRRHRAPRVPR